MKNVLSFVLLSAVAVLLCQAGPAPNVSVRADEMWISQIAHGESAFHAFPDSYSVYRNVMDFGCAGDGIRDDTACINTAISSGGRCGQFCGSSTVSPAIIYFPSGTYLVSSPIIMYYFSQLIGNANDPPTLVAAPTFTGMAVIDSNPYGEGGNNWYINQNNFFRQVRNFRIDLTRTPSASATTGIHWQVAQATSLFEIEFIMSKEANTQHQGIWMENGSGGFMSDLTFEGGKFGMWVGNQQFLSRNLVFNDCQVAIYMNWNWQWTFKGMEFNNVGTAIEMTAPSDSVASGIGSILLMDSTLTNTQIGVKTLANPNPIQDTSGSLLLDNVRMVNVGAMVADENGGSILPGGSSTIAQWGRGSLYQDRSGQGRFNMGNLPAVQKSANLLDGQGNFFAKSRPQYETLATSEFVNIKDYGAFGNGREDDTIAIQLALNDHAGGGKIIYFPHGAYVITNTVNVHPGTRIIGELWSVLMASGPNFADANNPRPMIRVGQPNSVGDVEITDIMFSTRGPAPGAILVEWNIRGNSQGSAGMWDSHFRVGGFMGSQLKFEDCPKGSVNPSGCSCVYMLMHVTPSGSGYFENVWAWTADHDLDNGEAQSQITIFAGRGILIESVEGPVWLYGTQSEHNIFYQYQISNARNVFMTMIQGETPYWQPGPKAPQPFTPNPRYHDPTYEHCPANSATCALSYGLRVHDSANVYLYGGGLYNFFNNYDQTCLNSEDCQDAMIDVERNTGFYAFNVNTKAALNIVVSDNTQVLATNSDNRNGFCQTINAFLSEV